ncbi:MAG: hypothetical protein ACK44D_00175 [Bacteroidia bacterium]
MLEFLFGDKARSSSTAFFKVINNTLIEIEKVSGNGSINSYIEGQGFQRNQIHVVYTFNADKVECLCFRSLSKDLVLVLAKDFKTKLSYSDVKKDVAKIDWKSEYNSLTVEDILQDGIETKNFDLNFMKSVLDLSEDSKNTYKSEQLGLYLRFENDILVAFTSEGWDNSATKWLTNINPTMVRKMTEEAEQYQENQMNIMEEVNQQANSILDTPNALKNEFIPLHIKSNGNINFFNLLITHYDKDCHIDDFLLMNKGRFRKINNYTIEVGYFIYTFSELGQLESCIKK